MDAMYLIPQLLQGKKQQHVQNRRKIKNTISSPVDWTNAWNVVLIADRFAQQSIPYLPGKHGWVLAFIVTNLFYDFRCGNFGLAASDNTRPYAPCLVIPVNKVKYKLCQECLQNKPRALIQLMKKVFTQE